MTTEDYGNTAKAMKKRAKLVKKVSLRVVNRHMAANRMEDRHRVARWLTDSITKRLVIDGQPLELRDGFATTGNVPTEFYRYVGEMIAEVALELRTHCQSR